MEEKATTRNSSDYALKLPGNQSPELADGTTLEGSSTRTGLEYYCGTAHIRADFDLRAVEDNYKILKLYETLFKNLGLVTSSKVGKTPATVSSLASDASERRISVFLILAEACRDDDPLQFATTLESLLAAIKEKNNPKSPKLLLFCRLKDPEDPTPDITDEEKIVKCSEMEWREAHPNVALIYKRGDYNNIHSFLKDLNEKIEHLDDPSDPAKCAPVKLIVDQLNENNTRRRFYHKGLEDNGDLRIEAFRFEDRLLKNRLELEGRPMADEGITVYVPDTSACYENNGDGKVLVISNEKFAKQSRRRGTRIDCENLKHLFCSLGFSQENIRVLHDLKASDMTEAVNDFCTTDCGSCAVLAILTHGSEGRLYGVEADDNGESPNWISDQAVISELSTASGLFRKPKLLIINACRNLVEPKKTYKSPGTDSAKINKSKREYVSYFLGSNWEIITDHSPGRAGLIVGYSTLPGEESSGLAYSGSRFISSLCWVLHHHADQEDILTMINKINDHITCFKETGTDPTTGNPADTRMQLPSWIVETTRKFYLVKVVAASNGLQTGSQELQCPLAALGCRFSTDDASKLAAHHEDSTDIHRKLCADKLRLIKSKDDGLRKEQEENRQLQDKVNWLQKELARNTEQ